MTEAAPETTKTSKDPERDKAIRSGYAIATRRLREENLERFRELQIEEVKKQGYDFTPQPTAEEKAQAELAALLDANPGLEAKLVDRLKSLDEQPSEGPAGG